MRQVSASATTGWIPATPQVKDFRNGTFQKGETMAPHAQRCPNVYDAEPIPEAARAEIDRLLQSGDLFRYTAPEDAPVALLEREFADLMGSKYALAVSSCSAAIFLSLRALDLAPARGS